MTLEEFVKRPPPTTGVPFRLEALTERELDVFRLLARGHTNQEIADHLYL
ncbi:MAG TPA: LuxR C-terminal-related transcriptional regulator, partial [Acidimicrobiia bacterium]|nr:LuxR C-terminal-related transcriptional regulator [Acidimicrobiia bacterium]